jgi:hypothetical protein
MRRARPRFVVACAAALLVGVLATRPGWTADDDDAAPAAGSDAADAAEDEGGGDDLGEPPTGPRRLPPADGTPLPGPVTEPRLPDRLLGPRGAEREAGQRGPVPPPSTDPSLAPAPPLLGPDGQPRAPGTVPPLPAPVLPTPTAEDLAGLDLWRSRWLGALAGVGVRHPERLERLAVHGRLRLRYRGRTTTDDRSDQDLYQSLALEVGNPWATGWYGSFNGRLAEDLDAFGTGPSFDFFSSIADVDDDRVSARLYHAYVGYRPCGGLLEDVRVGRQDVDAGAYLFLDGVHVQTRALPGLGGARLRAFGGVPASYFEEATSGDFLGGVGIEKPLGPCTTGRLDYVRIHDENGFYGARRNDLITAELRRRLAPDAQAWIRYSHLNGNPNELEVVYDGPLRRPDLTMRARWKTLLTAQNTLTYGLDPYAVITQALEPYHEGSVSVSRAIGRCHFVEGGAAGRWLTDADDEGRYNREFQRLYVLLGSKDWPRPHWSLGLTGEVWMGDHTIGSVGAQAEYRPSRCWRMRLGTDFQMYRTDFYRDEERIDSRSVFVDVRWQPREEWGVRLRVRWEDDDLATAWTVDTSVEFRF